MAWQSRLSGAVLILGLAGCSSVQTSTNYDPGAVQELDTYRTYSWLPMKQDKDPDERVYNPIIQARVHQAVDAQLQARGYRLVEPGQKSDFKVGWHGAIDTKVEADTVDRYSGYGWDPWYDPFFGPVGYGGSGLVDAPMVREYQQGTLVLDVVDADSNKLVWRGTAQAQLSERVDADESQKLINTSVEKMLKDFPPDTPK